MVVGLLVLLGLVATCALPSVRAVARYVTWRFLTRHSRERDFVDVGDCRLYVECIGSGDSLLLLHGGLTSFHVWYRQLPELSRRFRVHCLDLRGHGRSGRGQRPFGYRQMASDVSRVLAACGVARACVAGWSDGANVALMLAVCFPEKVSRVVAISANVDPSGLTRAQRERIASPAARRAPFWAAWVHGPGKSRADLHRLWHEVVTMWSNEPRLRLSDLHVVRTPVLLIRGEFDDVTAEHAEHMRTALGRSLLLTIPGCGHRLLQQAPGVILAQITEFCRRDPRGDD